MNPYDVYDRIPARPTTYKGIPMRSRLEATVAAEFDRDGIEWTYEPRAFANEYGQYLPDFVLEPVAERRSRVYLEVKPTMELAYFVMPRMQVIWDTDPDAMLVIVVGQDVVLSAMLPARKWRAFAR